MCFCHRHTSDRVTLTKTPSNFGVYALPAERPRRSSSLSSDDRQPALTIIQRSLFEIHARDFEGSRVRFLFLVAAVGASGDCDRRLRASSRFRSRQVCLYHALNDCGLALGGTAGPKLSRLGESVVAVASGLTGSGSIFLLFFFFSVSSHTLFH